MNVRSISNTNKRQELVELYNKNKINRLALNIVDHKNQ